jgi:hypothetical protein
MTPLVPHMKIILNPKQHIRSGKTGQNGDQISRILAAAFCVQAAHHGNHVLSRSEPMNEALLLPFFYARARAGLSATAGPGLGGC